MGNARRTVLAIVAAAAAAPAIGTGGATAQEQVVSYTASARYSGCSADPWGENAEAAISIEDPTVPTQGTWQGEEFLLTGSGISFTYTYDECSNGEADPAVIEGDIYDGQIGLRQAALPATPGLYITGDIVGGQVVVDDKGARGHADVLFEVFHPETGISQVPGRVLFDAGLLALTTVTVTVD